MFEKKYINEINVKIYPIYKIEAISFCIDGSILSRKKPIIFSRALSKRGRIIVFVILKLYFKKNQKITTIFKKIF